MTRYLDGETAIGLLCAGAMLWLAWQVAQVAEALKIAATLYGG